MMHNRHRNKSVQHYYAGSPAIKPLFRTSHHQCSPGMPTQISTSTQQAPHKYNIDGCGSHMRSSVFERRVLPYIGYFRGTGSAENRLVGLSIAWFPRQEQRSDCEKETNEQIKTQPCLCARARVKWRLQRCVRMGLC